MKLSIIVPTYNERDNIHTLIREINDALEFTDFEVIVVDDNSPDGTWRIAEKIKKDYPFLRVIRRVNERDLSTAVIEGFNQSKGTILAVMDADLQHPPKKINDMVKKILAGNDIVIGSRYIPGGEIEKWGMIRKLYSRTATLLAHLFVLQTRVSTDPLSGFFMIKRGVIKDIELTPIGYKILLEILAKGAFKKVADEPIMFRKREKGKSSLSPGVIWVYVRHLFRLSWETRELIRIGKFMAVGLTGVLVNLIVLWALTDIGHVYYLLSAICGIETSILSNFLLNDLWTFKDRKKTGISYWVHRLLKFNLISLPSFPMQLIVMGLLKEIFGMYYLLAAFIGIVVVFIWNFVANSLWTWKEPG